MIDRASGWVNVVPANVARVGLSTLYAMVLRDFIANMTLDTRWIQEIFEPFKANIVVGELSLEVANRVLWFHKSSIPTMRGNSKRRNGAVFQAGRR